MDVYLEPHKRGFFKTSLDHESMKKILNIPRLTCSMKISKKSTFKEISEKLNKKFKNSKDPRYILKSIFQEF